MKKWHLATIQISLEVEDNEIPEEVLVMLADQAEFPWRFYPKAPHYGNFMPYEYDWTRFFSEDPE